MDDERPLLLHSLSLYTEIIEACLTVTAPRRIVEIGSESGAFTEAVVAWAAAHGARVASIDPGHAERSVELAERVNNLELVSGYSPEALAELEPADVYIIDGDHNYVTVRGELAAIYGSGPEGPGPLSILHDVRWPAGRRDSYYSPDRLDPASVLAHSWSEGVRPGVQRTGPGGFRGMGAFAWARTEGGEANGVRGAVDHLLKERQDLRYVEVPAIFGVGFIYGSQDADALEALLKPLNAQPLLTALEQNRIDLYIRILDLQDELVAQRAKDDATLSALNDRVGRLEAENTELRHSAADRAQRPDGSALS